MVIFFGLLIHLFPQLSCFTFSFILAFCHATVTLVPFPNTHHSLHVTLFLFFFKLVVPPSVLQDIDCPGFHLGVVFWLGHLK